MKYRIIFILALAFCFSTIVFAQSKSVFFSKIEAAIEQDKINPRIREQSYRRDGDSFNYVLFLNLNGRQAGTVQLDRWKNLRDSKSDFNSDVEKFSLSKIVKDIPKAELKNVGDEAYIWTNISGATKIMFRKGDIFVSIFTPSEAISGTSSEQLAKTLAQYVAKYLP